MRIWLFERSCALMAEIRVCDGTLSLQDRIIVGTVNVYVVEIVKWVGCSASLSEFVVLPSGKGVRVF